MFALATGAVGALASDLSKKDIEEELKFYVGKTLELATAGKPYPQVVGHFASAERLKKEAADPDAVPGSINPDSKIFHEITYYFGEGKTKGQIVAVEFIPKPNTFDLSDMAAVFGEWRRSPQAPKMAAFALAWFAKHDVRSGARFSLYAEYKAYAATIDPKATPDRIYFHTADGRWD